MEGNLNFFSFAPKVEGSAAKVLNLLTSSERVSIDLHRLLVAAGVKEPERKHITDPLSQIEYGAKLKSDFLCNLVFREWKEILDEDEFRCFYYGKKLNAISQYNYYIFVEELQKEEERGRIQRLIQELFDKVKDRLPEENGVIDFLVSGHCCRIIELNPFNKYEGGGTGGALFRWREDWDILTKGPIEFRVTSEVFPELRHKFELFGLEKVVDAAIEKMLQAEEASPRKCCVF